MHLPARIARLTSSEVSGPQVLDDLNDELYRKMMLNVKEIKAYDLTFLPR